MATILDDFRRQDLFETEAEVQRIRQAFRAGWGRSRAPVS